ncbi:MAG: hypothetical protein ACK47D_03895 [Pseudanabaena sp.]|jgi:hypothetical protein|nr:hypothetical protein [Pseudanabaena sp. M079S1SP2A07QC]MCA6573795.1 hypothetical protein [Pseudanabaena sp. M53BS1SP1A06MG]MCA6580524.1 hypothetical protein [Pseudanabaena sp. M34BS1SP1A06MG]MCA6591155.1 hypothetical protein [Pseudanabaena sp. M38BS1SP1A06MG]MCA6600038.1 hypothetical protein [Pseudanabaena sp. M57BS1SP1A06MG]MCE2976744.1 hypothetical protein [Pseudanabaena sp. CoA8_M7]
MSTPVTPDMLDPKTPDDVIIQSESRKPETDPTLGIPVTIAKQGTPRHRLVAIGDSLTQGFQSGAIFNTRHSYPMIIAEELGWAKQMRYPTYDGTGEGLPLNLENLARQLERKYGNSIDWWELMPALLFLRDTLDANEDYWERGQGLQLPTQKDINHNLAVYGWDLCNTLLRNADICKKEIDDHPPKDDFLQQIVENANDRTALRVLNSARENGKALTPLQAATALGKEGTTETGTGDGIETLIVLIGANNALGSILTFKVNWSAEGYDDMKLNDRYTVWRPIHFHAELNKIVEEVKQIKARHVIFGTVPHVTIAPYARGVGGKLAAGSRYFPYYTLPWIGDDMFDPKKHPSITGQEARAIDSAIDQYNDAIADVVREGRKSGKDWYLFETAGLLDRLASRRYIEDPSARPSWWTPYPLPSALQGLSPVPTSQFFMSDPKGRTQGGLFSLDGIHPTTIGYGIVAQELIKIMQLAGVQFYQDDGKPRKGSIDINFERLIQLDTLISNPPRNVSSVFKLIEWFDRNFNLMSGLLKSNF